MDFVTDKHAVQMVNLVLDDPGPQSLDMIVLFATLCVKALHLDLPIPLYIHMDTGETETTFGHSIRPAVCGDQRVGQAHGASLDLRDE
jgi:hypothetical protein